MNHKFYKKVVLIIIDGFGVAPHARGNAVTLANTPTFNYLVNNFPSLTLQASGPLVGLPWGEMGNSEVGHLNLGAGRIVSQDLPRITKAIQSGEFFRNKIFIDAFSHSKKYNSAFHIIGMISPGGVHSLDEHVYALLAMAQQNGLRKVFIHMFTDGRDTEPKVAMQSLVKLRQKIQEIGIGEIATVSGRFFAMDRGGHWQQTKLAYNAMVNGQGETANSPEECIRNNYQKQIFDEMIKPTVILSDGLPIAKISDNDSVVFVNFRQDRALQLTQAFVEPQNCPEKITDRVLQNLFFATMTRYKESLPVHVAFGAINLNNSLSQVVAKSNLKQFHIAESEKYAHVTAFFDCRNTQKFINEDWIIVTSPDNARNYSNHPEMSAGKLTEILVEKITKTETNFFVANYANPDMVGHTGNLTATIESIEFVDKCVEKVVNACLQVDAALIITADHGNAEQMINLKTGDIDKDHTTNPVPLFLVANGFKFSKPLKTKLASLAINVPSGSVSDVAPTILELFGLPKPPEMTGINLLEYIGDASKKF